VIEVVFFFWNVLLHVFVVISYRIWT